MDRDSGKVFYYAHPSKEMEALKKHFTECAHDSRDVISDSSDRSNYQAMKQVLLHQGDTLVVQSLYALGHKKHQILKELKWMKENGIHLRVEELPITDPDERKPADPDELVMDTIMQTVEAFAKHETLTAAERQAEGIEAAKKMGLYRGRKPIEVDQVVLRSVYREYLDNKVTVNEMASELGISKSTLYKKMDENGLRKKRTIKGNEDK
jgi:DNA invertase Pin-like site-specific DNA recombinase